MEGITTHKRNFTESQNFLYFLTAAILSLPLFAQALGNVFGLNGELPIWLQAVLATLVQIVFIYFIFFKKEKVNNDILVIIATMALYLFSLSTYLLKKPYPLYFDATAIVVTFALLGHWLRFLAKQQSHYSLGKLIRQQPKEAFIEEGGKRIKIPIEQVEKGNVVLINAGEIIPVDGEVLEGHTFVIETMLTGESLPVEKNVGDRVYASTINKANVLKVIVTQVHSETNLSRYIHQLKAPDLSKSPTQKLISSINAIFVPLVIFLSACTFIGWWVFGGLFMHALTSAISVLLIASFPLQDALLILMNVAKGRAAENGILFTSFETIEKAGKVRIVVIDKTGSLTEGKPFIRQIYSYGNFRDNDILSIAASIEHYSQHPIGNAIRSLAIEQDIPIEPSDDFEHYEGKGVSGRKRGHRYYVGSLRLAKEHSLKIPDNIKEKEIQDGMCFVWNEKEIMGYIVVVDPLRKNCPQAIYNLNDMGIRTIMLTSDDYQKALYIASEAQIEEFYSGIHPEDKALEIQKLKNSRNLVAMVGDITNDAPPLAAADLGFAIISGSDIPFIINDVALLRKDLIGVVEAIQLSKATLHKGEQNLCLTFTYNLLGITLAALGLVHPIVAVAAMVASAFIVTQNALQLRSWRPTIHI